MLRWQHHKYCRWYYYYYYYYYRQTDRPTDGRTTHDSNTALALRESRGKNVYHLKQDLNSCWMMISQKLINNGFEKWSKRLFCWSFVCTLDTLNISSVNSAVICACCKLLLSRIPLKRSRVVGIDIFWVVRFPRTNQKTFNSIVQTKLCSFLSWQIWTFWWKTRDFVAQGCKVTVH